MAPDKRIPVIFTKDCGYVPAILVNAGEIIEKHITTKHLFQVQGSTTKVKQLMSVLSLQKLPRLRKVHVHDVVEVIKVCLSRLSIELIPEHVMKLLIEANQSQMTDFTAILALFHRISPITFASVHFTMRLLNKVIQNSASNGMDVRKLSTIFVLDILKPLTSHDKEDQQEYDTFRLERVEKLPYLIMVIEQLILNVNCFKSATVWRGMKMRNGSSVDSVHRRRKDSAASLLDAQESGGLAQGYLCPTCHSPIMDQTGIQPCLCGDNDVDGLFLNAQWDTPSTDLLGQSERFRQAGRHQGAVTRGGSRASAFNNSSKDHSVARRRNLSGKSTPDHVPKEQLMKVAGEAKSRKGVSSLSSLRHRVKKKKQPVKSKIACRWKGGTAGKGSRDDCHATKPLTKAALKANKKPGRPKKAGSHKSAPLPFHRDEELLPWTNEQTDTDDSSLMIRTIRAPRFYKSRLPLPHAAECANQRELEYENYITSDRMSNIGTSSPEILVRRKRTPRGRSADKVYLLPRRRSSYLDASPGLSDAESVPQHVAQKSVSLKNLHRLKPGDGPWRVVSAADAPSNRWRSLQAAMVSPTVRGGYCLKAPTSTTKTTTSTKLHPIPNRFVSAAEVTTKKAPLPKVHHAKRQVGFRWKKLADAILLFLAISSAYLFFVIM